VRLSPTDYFGSPKSDLPPQRPIASRTMIGYKSAKHGDKRVVVTLEIPEDALTNMGRSKVAAKETAKYCANKANVLKIEDDEGNCYPTATSFNYREKTLEYKVGEVMEEPSYNPQEVCAEGIHFFLSRRVAELYGMEKVANGLFEMWYENGQKGEEVPYVNGQRHGLRETWFGNGQKSEELEYVYGKMYGLYRSWYENGQKDVETTFVDGQRHGLYQSWHENGQKMDEIPYVNGQRHGLYQRWYRNGQKTEEIEYVYGKIHGLYRIWYENGQKWEECEYVNGEKHRLYQRWDRDGNKLVEKTYVNGVPQ